MSKLNMKTVDMEPHVTETAKKVTIIDFYHLVHQRGLRELPRRALYRK